MDVTSQTSFYHPPYIGGGIGYYGIKNNHTNEEVQSYYNYSSHSFFNIIDNLSQNTVFLDETYPDFSQIPTVRGLFVFLFITVCFVGVVGNLLVCLTVYRNQSMHSPVNYYIVNLGVCDFLVVSFVLPMKLFELIGDSNTNMMNDFWCTILRFLESVVVFASVFTLVAICIERYYAVVYPVLSRVNMTDGRIRRVILVVWLIPILCATPSLYPSKSETIILQSEYGEISRTVCFDQFSGDFRFGYFLFLLFFMHILPLVFIASTCISITKALMQNIPIHPNGHPRAVNLELGRRKVAKMVLVVVFAFIFCWSPYFIITAITQVHYNFFDKGQFFFTMLIINLLAFTHSCINPIVYFSMSARFRKGFMCVVDSLMLCVGRSLFSPENSGTMLQGSSRRQLNYPQTNYTEVFQYNSGEILQRNRATYLGCSRDNRNCHNIRHLDGCRTNYFGNSLIHTRRYPRYSYSSSQDSTSDFLPSPLHLRYDATGRQPEFCNELIPLHELQHGGENHSLGVPA